jgi:hypothetical protein
MGGMDAGWVATGARVACSSSRAGRHRLTILLMQMLNATVDRLTQGLRDSWQSRQHIVSVMRMLVGRERGADGGWQSRRKEILSAAGGGGRYLAGSFYIAFA